jgi:hypothetical protein
VSVAVISLTYTINDGTSYHDIYTTQDLVEVPNLNCYQMQFHQKDCPPRVTKQAVAHAHRELALASECGNYTEASEVQNSKHDYRYYCRRIPSNREEFAYRFNEYNPIDTQRVYPYFTNRGITAAAGKCVQYDVNGKPEETNRAKTFTYKNGNSSATITIPNSSLGMEGTTYIYRDTKGPAFAETYACGPRCIRMWAHKNPSGAEPDAFYECPIEISLVSNVTRHAHNVTDDVARIAAASIALQGRFTGELNDPNVIQYQFYASG